MKQVGQERRRHSGFGNSPAASSLPSTPSREPRSPSGFHGHSKPRLFAGTLAQRCYRSPGFIEYEVPIGDLNAVAAVRRQDVLGPRQVLL
jgi:hypothetical protein